MRHQDSSGREGIESMTPSQLTLYFFIHPYIRELLPKRKSPFLREFDVLSKNIPRANGHSINVSSRLIQKGAALSERLIKYGSNTNDALAELASCMNGIFTLNSDSFEQRMPSYKSFLEAYVSQAGPH